MERKFRNWKESIFSFVIGFFAGRYTTRYFPTKYQMYQAENSETASNDLSQEAMERSKEETVQAFVLLAALIKEGIKEKGYEITKDDIKEDIQSIDFDKIVERSIANTVKKVGSVPESEIQLVQSWGRSLGRSLLPIMTRIAVSTIPAVPVYASPQTYALVFEAIEKIFREKVSDEVLNDSRWIPELESLLDKWQQESKPETYTRPVLHAINTIRAVRLEKLAS